PSGTRRGGDTMRSVGLRLGAAAVGTGLLLLAAMAWSPPSHATTLTDVQGLAHQYYGYGYGYGYGSGRLPWTANSYPGSSIAAWYGPGYGSSTYTYPASGTLDQYGSYIYPYSASNYPNPYYGSSVDPY